MTMRCVQRNHAHCVARENVWQSILYRVCEQQHGSLSSFVELVKSMNISQVIQYTCIPCRQVFSSASALTL